MSAASEAFWRQLPYGPEVELIAHDANGLGALAKPAGILSHPNSSEDRRRSLLIASYQSETECFEWRDEAEHVQRLYLLNRLDSATSGVILVAASENLAKEIRSLFLRRNVQKIYEAVVFGNPGAPRQVWRDRLAVEKRGGRVRAQAAAGNIPAEAHVRVQHVRVGTQTVSLIALEPKTGRSHQLRVQCAKRHLPIVGDATYGDFSANRAFAQRTELKRLFLHSLETRFEYDWAGKKFSFSARAPLPKDFAEALGLKSLKV